jgi:carboxylesterase
VTAPILPGAEPFSHRGGPLGVLVLHGFTGSPQSVRPQADALAAAGFTVDLPLWPGHGTSVEDLVPKRWPDWSEAAEAAFHKLAGECDAVALFGLSMGGSLACWLAEHHPEIRGLCLVNPLVDPPADSFRDVLRAMLDGGAEVAPGVGSDIARADRTELAYTGTPLAAALSLFEGLDAVAARLDHITCPVLVLSSREDHVVPSSSGDVLCAGVSGPAERVWLEKSYHVATLDHDEDEITRRAVAFAGQVLGASPSDEVGAGTTS